MLAMEYKYNLAKLQDQKEKVEELIAGQKLSRVFPQPLEDEFWTKNLERARKHTDQYVWAGLLIYFIGILILIPTDYWIIDKQYFVHDFVLSLIGIINGGISLFVFYLFSSLERLKPFFQPASLVLIFWALVSISCLTMSIQTAALQHQSMAIVTIIYVLGYILTGVKPIQMMITGVLAAGTTIICLTLVGANFNPLVFGRILLGSCLLGFVISHMIFARERMIFLYSMRARISEQIHRIHNTELLHLSQHDELTKISNRRTFDEMLEIYFSTAQRQESSLAILFIDVDFFKNYNDFYGHQKGDDVISTIAKTIKNAIRHMDFVARYGGEEFVVLLPETDAHGAYAVSTNIFKAIERLEIPHEKSLVSKQITVSLGITVYRGEQAMTKDGLLGIADQALYRAKQLGRNQIYYQSIASVNSKPLHIS
ncbi:GGDEF domain-containing protein [Acinetobacter schindleri]|uniref:diguanylate cyclase n=2 Tax=Acinetobacter schindleri TaxID=108981 RepID=A0AAE6WWE9_9GAMM|nr:GGDEF domain-containing protein [Acinetobacter schindleri]QIC67748.1 GGDEF domain-containing protein [Acinetobacter schindleri]